MEKVSKKARRKWESLGNEEKDKILKNVYCSECMVTEIVDCTIEEIDIGIVLRGKCKKCGKKVARVVEG